MPCCCGGLGGCSCGDPPVTRNFPSSVTVTLALGGVFTGVRWDDIFIRNILGQTGCCIDTSNVQAAVNGTYIFYPSDDQPDGDRKVYVLPGYGSVYWYCNGSVVVSFDVCLVYLGLAVSKTCANGATIYCLGRWRVGPFAIQGEGECERTSYSASSTNLLAQYAFGVSFTNCPQSPTSYRLRGFDLDVTVTGNF